MTATNSPFRYPLGAKPPSFVDASDPAALLGEISEKDFSQEVVELAEALGWTVFRTHDSRHSPDGEPDLRMVHPVLRRVVWAELKAANGKLRPAQLTAIETLRQAGAEVYVWQPADWEYIVKVLQRFWFKANRSASAGVAGVEDADP